MLAAGESGLEAALEGPGSLAVLSSPSRPVGVPREVYLASETRLQGTLLTGAGNAGCGGPSVATAPKPYGTGDGSLAECWCRRQMVLGLRKVTATGTLVREMYPPSS